MYDPNDNMSKERVPHYSMQNSPRKDMSRNNDPGPGNYNEKSGLGGPSYTINGKKGDKQRDGTPGPGYYEAKN